MVEGIEEEEEEDESPSARHKITTTLEISMINNEGYKSRHSQPECGYALEPSQWTEYCIHTMDPDNLELIFEFFEVCENHCHSQRVCFVPHFFILITPCGLGGPEWACGSGRRPPRPRGHRMSLIFHVRREWPRFWLGHSAHHEPKLQTDHWEIQR